MSRSLDELEIVLTQARDTNQLEARALALVAVELRDVRITLRDLVNAVERLPGADAIAATVRQAVEPVLASVRETLTAATEKRPARKAG